MKTQNIFTAICVYPESRYQAAAARVVAAERGRPIEIFVEATRFASESLKRFSLAPW
jgi:hypothetical protein